MVDSTVFIGGCEQLEELSAKSTSGDINEHVRVSYLMFLMTSSHKKHPLIISIMLIGIFFNLVLMGHFISCAHKASCTGIKLNIMLNINKNMTVMTTFSPDSHLHANLH